MLRCALLFLCVNTIKAGVPPSKDPAAGLKDTSEFLKGEKVGTDFDFGTPRKMVEKTVATSGSAMKAGLKSTGAGSSVDPTLKTVDTGASADTSMKSPDGGAGGFKVISTGTDKPGDAQLIRSGIDPEVARKLAEVIRGRADRQIDPAVCDTCTEELCDLPDPQFCYRYIMCVRGTKIAHTKRYRYIPLGMECPYGTFWDYRTNSCNQPKTKEDCLNEPCRDLFVRAYKHQDPNCKTYWQCTADGVSKPMCCADKMGFNTTSQECDETVPCGENDICPRLDKSVDRCNTDMFMRNSPLEDGNCRTYWKCEKMMSVPTCCPLGKMYVQGSDPECVVNNSCTAHCPDGFRKQDSCRTDPGTIAYRHQSRCRHYMKCLTTATGSRIPRPLCCPNGYFFDDSTKGCTQYIEGQTLECTDITENCLDQFFECGLRRGNDSRHFMYWQKDSENMPCADGTRFNEYDCHCSIFVNETYTCRKDFQLVFNNPATLENLAVNNWIGKLTNSIAEDAETRINTGHFDGKSAVILEQLSFNDFEKFTIVVRFRHHHRNSDGRAILFSNCRTNRDLNGMSPSLEVALIETAHGRVIELAGSNDTHGKTDQEGTPFAMHLPYELNRPYEVSAVWDGQVIKLTRWELADSVEPKVDLNTAMSVAQPLTGRLYRGEHYAMIGACKLGLSTDLVQGFSGELFLFEFAKCVLDSAKEKQGFP